MWLFGYFSVYISCINLTLCVFSTSSSHVGLPPSLSSPHFIHFLCLSQSLHLYQNFLYFSTLLFLRSELCFSNNCSHRFLPAFVAAAVLKQVLDAIWPASVFC